MSFFIKVIGIIFFAMGVTFVSKPGLMLNLISFFKQDNKIYFAGVIRIILGIFFLFAASSCKISAIITLLGILCLIFGALIFIIPKPKLIEMLTIVESKPVNILRMLSGILIFISILIIIAA